MSTNNDALRECTYPRCSCVVNLYGAWSGCKALSASKPEPQAQAGEPEVYRLMSLHGMDEFITLQSHREAIARAEADLQTEISLSRELCQASAKKDAALKACVDALNSKRTYQSADGCWHDTWDSDLIAAAITQAKEAL